VQSLAYASKGRKPALGRQQVLRWEFRIGSAPRHKASMRSRRLSKSSLLAIPTDSNPVEAATGHTLLMSLRRVSSPVDGKATVVKVAEGYEYEWGYVEIVDWRQIARPC